MDRRSRVAMNVKGLSDDIDVALAVTENNAVLNFFIINEPSERCSFLFRIRGRHPNDALGDGFCRHVFTCNLY